ncbi:MAG: hypothetical protein IPK07_22445 [Deltaproteobacteria bacterium]|nr:hypothetical protein [Deltaproteobacteria bacterium]
MSRFGGVATSPGAFASRAVVAVSVAALVAAAAVSQFGVLAGARITLGDRPVLSWAGLFAALATTQALVYGMVVIASLGPALRRLAAASCDEPGGVAETRVGDDARLRSWLVLWAVAAVALRAALAHGVGIGALLASP